MHGAKALVPPRSRLPVIPPGADPREILSQGLVAAGGEVALSCSFSAEDVALVDLLAQVAPGTRILSLDTGRLPEETYEVAEKVRDRYGARIEWYFPQKEPLERLLREKGAYSFRDSLADRQRCCQIRKTEPLGRGLRGLAGWITGLRREQAPTRAGLLPLEVDEAHGGLLKINPLCDWTEADVLAYTAARGLPQSRLYARGYRSIGCAPCTRPVAPGEPLRAGRWWWEDPDHKECGLHR